MVKIRACVTWGTLVAGVLAGVTVVQARPAAAVSGEEAGRWKLSQWGCHWDPNDTGPDQCDPSMGRWKLSQWGCVWDPTDTGPHQCVPDELPPAPDSQASSKTASSVTPANVASSTPVTPVASAAESCETD